MSSERISIEEARTKLGELRGREYWRSLEELLETEDFREHLHREFRVPIESGVNRRELLTLMGASIALAGLTGCTRQPTERIFPYVKAPEELVPGEPLFYATAHVHGGYARGILAKSYEGRPIKIEGNELHPASLGGTDVFAQASILDIYDPDRSQTLTERGQIRPWSAFLAAARLAVEKERPNRGAGIRFLTGTVTSPTLEKQIGDVLAAFPAAKWVAWEPVGRDNVARGALLAFGEVVEPRYAFDKADVVVSLESDFLGAGPAMPRYVRDFTSRRKAEGTNRLYAVESTPTLTGARADHRRPMSPAEIEGFAAAVAVAVGAIAGAAPTDPFVEAVAADLKAHRGSGLVVAGESQPPPVHALAHAINEALGNAGNHRHLLRARGRRTGRPGGGVRGARRRDGGGQGLDPRHRRGQPGLHGARGPRLREGARQGRPAHPPRPLRRRDLAPLPLARRGGAPARGLERRARVRRHRHDPAAAHRAALRRQVGARAARGVLRSAREDGPRHRQGVLERQAARRRLRARLAQGPPRRPRRGQRRARRRR